ncbi:RNA polymerase II-associated factor 1 homolog [Patella vulgata]|uniref:RNA polymerase II-associated factor 1 homolog n=1 Tax=Patella vulgata TaxID=6465 RepID=UPI0024A98A5C|nr:RNA polymerase II-associated factor 1 homolog [Patella vulgata]
MPPTIQTGSREDRDKRVRPGEKRSDLLCRVKFNNTLPDIPFDPKFITYPFESNRFIQYKPTSLERSYKYDLLTEHDLGVTIDLINPETYRFDHNVYPEPEDERLLEDELNTPADAKRSRHNNTNVSWLRKTEYISTEYNRFIQKTDKSEIRVGFKIKQKMKEDDMYKDRDSQIEAIEKTFEKAKGEITQHYSKPNVTPVEVLPIFPDFKLWQHPFAQVLFDSDPAPKGQSLPAQMEEMSQAMIRGAVDESGEQFVAYFLPTDETLTKRKRDAEEEKDYVTDEVYDYMLAREYNWNVKNKLSKGYEETYFFVMREDGVYYDELETRVRLSKRRKTGGTQAAKSRLLVKHRPFNEKEENAQKSRQTMLEPPAEEEEEEEEVQLPDITTKSDDEGGNKSPRSGDEENKSEDEEDKHSVQSGGSRRSRSRSKTRSRSRSRSGSRSRSRSRSGSRSGSGSRSSSGSESGSDAGSKSSDSESEAEDKKGKKDEEEIFGSASSSSSDSD